MITILYAHLLLSNNALINQKHFSIHVPTYLEGTYVGIRVPKLGTRTVRMDDMGGLYSRQSFIFYTVPP